MEGGRRGGCEGCGSRAGGRKREPFSGWRLGFRAAPPPPCSMHLAACAQQGAAISPVQWLRGGARRAGPAITHPLLTPYSPLTHPLPTPLLTTYSPLVPYLPLCSLLTHPLLAHPPQVKGLDTDALYVSHIQVNKAQKGRRRTYRAHGRINPYMSSPCHIELILAEKEAAVKAELVRAGAGQRCGALGTGGGPAGGERGRAVRAGAGLGSQACVGWRADGHGRSSVAGRVRARLLAAQRRQASWGSSNEWAVEPSMGSGAVKRKSGGKEGLASTAAESICSAAPGRRRRRASAS